MTLTPRYPAPPNVADYTTFLQTDVGIPGSALAYPLADPTTPPVLSAVAGGSLAATTYFVKYTYVNAGGETLASTEASLAVGANELLVVASPPALLGAATWSAYVSNTGSGGTGTETLQAKDQGFGSNWSLPTSGLVAGTALPGANTTTTSPFIPDTLLFATDIVNQALYCAAPTAGTLATYNLAADYLINSGVDVPGSNYFTALRKNWNINAVTTGIVTSTFDEGTGTTVLNQDQMKAFTMADLQNMKTPYGRAYLAFAQKYGQTLWGRT